MNTDKIYAELLAAEYAPKTSRKVIALKKLDKRAKLPAVVVAYALGIASALLFGTGIYLLTWQLLLGLFFSAVGICIMLFNYSLFKKLREKAKQRYAFEIVEIAKEICGYDTYR